MRIHEQIAQELAPAGRAGFLRCEECGYSQRLSQYGASSYLAAGWPKCCGYTMRRWTQRQVDAGEVPSLALVRRVRSLRP